MAKVKCPFCKDGFIHTSNGIPNPKEWLLISDTDFEKEEDNIKHEELYERMTHLFKCVNCEAIAIFWNGFGNKPKWYNIK